MGELCWLAEVTKSQAAGQEQSFYYELEDDAWIPLANINRFNHTVQALPRDFILMSMFNAYAYMTDHLSWNAVERALRAACRKHLISTASIQRFEAQIHKETERRMLLLD